MKDSHSSNCRFLRGVLSSKDWPDISGQEVAFWGRSNVGKSSLLNALMKSNGLAKVSKTPGRTQSINFYQIQEGVRYIDLPGYGYACIPEGLQNMWHQHVLDYVLTRSNLCLVVVLVDSRRDAGSQDLQVMKFLEQSHIPFQCIYTKIDCISSSQRSFLKLNEREKNYFRISAHTEEGIVALLSHIFSVVRERWYEFWEKFLLCFVLWFFCYSLMNACYTTTYLKSRTYRKGAWNNDITGRVQKFSFGYQVLLIF